jgi:hypothetical protein
MPSVLPKVRLSWLVGTLLALRGQVADREFPQVKLARPGRQPLLHCRLQQLQLGIVVSRDNVLDIPRTQIRPG